MSKSNDLGYAFEKFVYFIFDKLYFNTKHDVWLQKETKEGTMRAQIDLTYGLLRQNLVECKYHSSGFVSFQEVSKFSLTLEQFGYAQQRGVIVTNTDFSIRSKNLIRRRKLKSMSGNDLMILYIKSLKRSDRKKFKKNNVKTLEDVLNRFF